VENAGVTGIRIDHQGGAVVETTKGNWHEKVVNCAGAWAAEIAAMAGLDCLSNLSAACWFRLNPRPISAQRSDDYRHVERLSLSARGSGVSAGVERSEETPGYKTDFDAAFIEKILTRAAERVPIFENLAVNPKRAWPGSTR